MVGRLNWSLEVLPSAAEASRVLADRLVQLSADAIARSGRFTLAVSGGRTPADLYTLLAREYQQKIPWGATELFFADERAVPPQDDRSNFALVQRTLLSKLPAPGPRVHRIEGERSPAQAEADRYEADLRATLRGAPAGPPTDVTFDVILLGVGSDGHTASLFPGAPSLEEASRWTIVEPSPHLDPKVTRISLTMPVIRSSRKAIFLVCGDDKGPILKQVFEDPARGTLAARLPSAMVGTSEGVDWYLDSAAAPRAEAAPSA